MTPKLSATTVAMSLSDCNPTQRFSNRVADYIKYRPSYPSALIDYLFSQLPKGATVADIGAGTGILTKLMLERDAIVYAIEPNKEMREAAVEDLNHFQSFKAIDGSAEKTGLPPAFVDLITSAQAFHWFDPDKTREEFDRVLAPGGRVALIWNDHVRETALGQDYENLKAEFGGEDFKKVTALSTTGVDESMQKFFKPTASNPNGYESKTFDNYQDLDQAGLIGRFFSSSYAPTADSPLHQTATAALKDLFAKYSKNGMIRFDYKTELFLGS